MVGEIITFWGSALLGLAAGCGLIWRLRQRRFGLMLLNAVTFSVGLGLATFEWNAPYGGTCLLPLPHPAIVDYRPGMTLRPGQQLGTPMH